MTNPVLSQEKAIEEIHAIYKLANLTGCFIVGDLTTKANPILQIAELPDEEKFSKTEITAYCTAMIVPLYQGIISMLSFAGVALDSSGMVPKSGDKYTSMREYFSAALDRMRSGNIESFYQSHCAHDSDIPKAAKEAILHLLSSLTK